MPKDRSDRPSGPPDGPRKRRPRYPGKYPRQFEHRYKELAPESHPEIHEHVRSQGRTPAGTHVPVLVAEVMEALRPAPGETVVDCTVGYGGHALELLRRIGPTGRLLGFDVDAENLDRTRKRLEAAEKGAAPISGSSEMGAVPFSGLSGKGDSPLFATTRKGYSPLCRRANFYATAPPLTDNVERACHGPDHRYQQPHSATLSSFIGHCRGFA